MAERDDVGKIVIAFFAGATIGAVAGLLLAPSSGAETRQKIKDATITAKDKAVEKIGEVKDKAAEKIGEAKEGAAGILSRGKDKVGEVKSQIQAAVDAGKEAYKQKKSEMEPKSEEEA